MWILALCIVPWPYFLRHNIELRIQKIEEACKDVNVSIEYRDGEQPWFEYSIVNLLRTEEVGNMASYM